MGKKKSKKYPYELLDEKTHTFRSDMLYCNRLLESSSSLLVARILVYYIWARNFLPHVQTGLTAIAKKRFPESCRKDAITWTALLSSGVLKDICLTPYLVVRGLFSEAGSVIRRSLEHVGVLTHFWAEPGKAAFLSDPDSTQFNDSFVREGNPQRAKELKDKKIRKRFAAFSVMGTPASDMYKILSSYDVHGGTPLNVVRSLAEENSVSCGFIDRKDPNDQSTLIMLHSGIEIILVEILELHGQYGKPYGVTPPMVGEGGRLFSELLSPIDRPSPQMLKELTRVQQDLGVNIRIVESNR